MVPQYETSIQLHLKTDGIKCFPHYATLLLISTNLN